MTLPVSSHRLLRFSGLVVAALLLALAFYPGTFASPYITSQDSPEYAHTIVPESSPLYEEYTSGYDHEVYQYSELSQTGQELFDRTRESEPRPQYNGERRFIPDVCRGFVLVCDTYSQEALPAEFTYGTELSYEEAFVFVEDGGDRYLLQTGWPDHGGLFAFPVRAGIAWLTLIPLGVFVAVVSVRSESDRVRAGTAAAGGLVAVLGVLTPYLHMSGVVRARTVGVLLLGGVWLTLLAVGISTVVQSQLTTGTE